MILKVIVCATKLTFNHRRAISLKCEIALLFCEVICFVCVAFNSDLYRYNRIAGKVLK